MAQIIYAEDDDIIADIVSRTLAHDGHEVKVFGDGTAAIHAIKSSPPDLIILDCTLPGITGIELLRRLRLEQALFKIPVIMLTARHGKSDVSIATYAGADEYIKKPFDPEYLAFAVENLLSKGRRAGNIRAFSPRRKHPKLKPRLGGADLSVPTA